VHTHVRKNRGGRKGGIKMRLTGITENIQPELHSWHW